MLSDLRAIGAVDGDAGGAEPAPGWLALARAAATGRGRILVTRVRAGRSVVVEIRCGPEGLVAAPEAAADVPVDVAVQPPWALARTVWRVSRWSGGREPLPVSASDLDLPALLAPFSESGGGWWDGPATLTRIDLALPEVEAVSLALVDTGTHMAEVEGDAAGGFRVRPSSPEPFFAALCGWQRALAGLGPAPAAPIPARSEDVSLPGGQRFPVAVGDDWVAVPAPTPAWAAPAQDGFSPNVVVTAAAAPLPADPAALGAELSGAVPDLRVVDVVRTRPGMRSTAVHPTSGRDAVTVQERRLVDGTTLSVAYTCSVEQYPEWSDRFATWMDELG